MEEEHFTFQHECLDAINMVRTEHDCPPLKFSDELTKLAQCWADQLIAKNRPLFAEYAENVDAFEIPSDENGKKPLSGALVVASWANERQKYNFDEAKWSAETANFTQMVWKSSKEFGVGKSTSKDGRHLFVVAFYKPSGNMNKMGDFACNVPKLPTV